MSENTNPIYDQTVEAQGFDPIRERYLVVMDESTGEGTLSAWQSREINKGRVGGFSIRKGGKRR